MSIREKIKEIDRRYLAIEMDAIANIKEEIVLVTNTLHRNLFRKEIKMVINDYNHSCKETLLWKHYTGCFEIVYQKTNSVGEFTLNIPLWRCNDEILIRVYQDHLSDFLDEIIQNIGK